MNIVHIIPGSGGSFYCGNCLRDSKLVAALRKSGHEVIKVPMYLPLFSDEEDLSQTPVFYGAVSIYLKQLYPIFRKAPKWLDNLLNSKPLLKYAAGKAGTTRAKGLEDMTISMLLGEEGKQSEELNKMVDWIGSHCRPDIVHLSNALLLGLAGRIKSKLNVPVVCSLQDEHTWVDVMQAPFRSKVWKLMAQKSEDVDTFMSVSTFYADLCENKMMLEKTKIKTMYLGVDPDDYDFKNSVEKERNIGFLSRMCYDNGLDILVDAFIKIKSESEFKDVKLFVTGGSTHDDRAFINKIKKKIKNHDLDSFVNFDLDFTEEGKRAFFKEIAILSVPVRFEEAFGIYLIESMASGIPVIQPDTGAFTEIINKSNNGLLIQDNSPEQLAYAIIELLRDKNRLRSMSNACKQIVETKYNIYKLADDLIDIYQETIKSKKKIF